MRRRCRPAFLVPAALALLTGLGTDPPSPALAADPEIQWFSPRSGPPSGPPARRDIVWSQPYDLNGFKVSSEIIAVYGLESKIADDFLLPESTTVYLVRFWGGYYNWTQGDPPVTAYNLYFYDDSGCYPDDILRTYLHLPYEGMFVGYDGYGYPTYRYEFVTDFSAVAGQRYWLVAQADDHSFPPQWGRQQALEERECDSMFQSWYPWGWTATGDLVGEPWDASFELEASTDRQACCMDDGSCWLLPEEACLDQGGEPQGPGTTCAQGTCPPGFACCFDDASCRVLTEEVCLETGGQILAGETACAPNPCTDLQACCYEDGSCEFLYPQDCLASGGESHGSGTVCDPNPCPVLVGACCFDNGSCVMLQPPACIEAGGTPIGIAIPCAPNPCEEPAACCLDDGSCVILLAADCGAAGGLPGGYGSDCDPNPCARACCFEDGSCAPLPPGDCDAAGGESQEGMVLCDPDPCPDPAACCFALGTCRMLTQAHCVREGGAWGAGDCNPNPCAGPDVARACCLPDGSCALLPVRECMDQGGIAKPPGVGCDPDPCSPPLQRACCFNDGACVLHTAEECSAAGGLAQGACTTCDPNPCQATAVEPTTWGRIRGLFR